MLGDGHGARHDPRRGVRDPDVEHLTGPDDVVERAHDLVDRRERIPDVDPVDVDVAGPEPSEAGLERLDEVLAVGAARIRIAIAGVQRVLRRQHPVVPVARDQLPNQSLALARGVVVRGIDEVASGLAEGLEDSRALVLLGAPAPRGPEGHRAEAKLRNA
jgi:hypothetical protein